MNKEVWKDIKGYEGKYQVSNLGRVKSLIDNQGKQRTMILKQSCEKYCKVTLLKNSKQKRFRVHRLVAEAFIPNPNNYLYINHKDENPKNNVVDNLEWCTMAYNNTYGHRLKNVCKKVGQYDLQGNLIKVWNSFMDIQRELGFSNSSINSCCKGRRKTAGGFIWRYVNE